jgi:hypothetical protein
VLGIYLATMVLAITSRARSERWTMPEFQEVDLTTMNVPPSVRRRICMLKGAEPLSPEG